MAQEINKLLDQIIDKFKLAMNILFDAIDDIMIERPTGFPRTKQEIKDKIQKAMDIYHEFFPYK